jgi:cytochrome P450
MCAGWQDGETRDISKDMNRVTMLIAAQTLFGADFFAETEQVRVALNEILDEFDHTMLPPGESDDFLQALKKLDAPIFSMIEARRPTFEQHDDLLSSLMQVHMAEGTADEMTDRQLRDEAMTIFIAGHETTANALTWAWYLLSQHPEIETALQREVAEVLGTRQATFEDVPKLQLTERIFSESLRLYPPLWIIGRQAMADVKIGDYDVPKGSYCFVSPFVMQRDPRYFPDPEKFDPDRWLPEAKAARPKYSYFPFSGGSRSCLGENFAWMEGALLMAMVVQKWQFRLQPDHTIKLQTNLTLRSKYGMPVTLLRRG